MSIVITGDGVTLFDTTILDLAYNDAGSVLTLTSGPTAGSLAATANDLAIDLFADLVELFPGSGIFISPPIVPGDLLATGSLFVLPPAGFADNIGGFGIESLIVVGFEAVRNPFDLIGDGQLVEIANLTFEVTSLGSSTLDFATVPPNPGLSLNGAAVAHTLVAGSVALVPEPSGVLLFSVGMLVVSGMLRRRAA